MAEFKDYSELRMLDAIRSYPGISDDEQKSLINKLIDD